MAFSAYVRVSNDLDESIEDVQVLLDNNHDQTQLFEFGAIRKKTSTSIKYGIIIHPKSSDHWTVTYHLTNGDIYRVNRKDFGVKSDDAGREVVISIKQKDKVNFKRNNSDSDATADKVK
jgi:hypothetical protein